MIRVSSADPRVQVMRRVTSWNYSSIFRGPINDGNGKRFDLTRQIDFLADDVAL